MQEPVGKLGRKSLRARQAINADDYGLMEKRVSSSVYHGVCSLVVSHCEHVPNDRYKDIVWNAYLINILFFLSE